MISIPREEIDLDRYVSALLALAMHRVEDEQHQTAALRGEVKLLPQPHPGTAGKGDVLSK